MSVIRGVCLGQILPSLISEHRQTLASRVSLSPGSGSGSDRAGAPERVRIRIGDDAREERQGGEVSSGVRWRASELKVGVVKPAAGSPTFNLTFSRITYLYP